jgi:hypothetical protein
MKRLGHIQYEETIPHAQLFKCKKNYILVISTPFIFLIIKLLVSYVKKVKEQTFHKRSDI